MNVKICVVCGAEYQMRAQVCADCGGRLETRRDASDLVNEPVDEPLEVVFLGPVAEAHRLKKALAPFELDVELHDCHDHGWTGFVAHDPDLGAAAVVEVLVPRRQVSRAESVRARLGLPPTLEPEYAEYVDGCCPACGATLSDPPGEECADCGLALGGGDTEGDSPDSDPTAAAGGGWLPNLPDA